jgi:hypothetical protein
MRNPRESIYCPEASVGLPAGQPTNRRLMNRRLSFFLILYNSFQQLRSATQVYNSAYDSSLQLHPTKSTTHYWGICAYHAAYYYYYYRLPRRTPPTEPRDFEKYCSQNSNTVQEYQSIPASSTSNLQ